MKKSLSWAMSLLLFLNTFMFLAPAVYAEGKSNIESFTVEDVTVSPLDAEFDRYSGFFYYDYPIIFTVTLSDGTTQTFQTPRNLGIIIIDGIQYNWYCENQIPESEWQPGGVYTETIYLSNYDSDF